MKTLILLIYFVLAFSNLFSQHQAVLLGGGNYQFESAKFAANACLMYEYKDLEFSSLIGVGLATDIIFRDDMTINGGPTVFLHPDDNIFIGLAPGIAYDSFSSTRLINDKLKSNDLYFNLKVLAGYNFQINERFSVLPVVNWDIYKNYSSLSIKVGVGINF